MVPTYYPAIRYGGPITSVRGLCNALVKRGHCVEVATTGVDGVDDLYTRPEEVREIDGVNIHYFRCRRFRRIYYSRAMKLFLCTDMSNFDIVHIHSVFLWPTWRAAQEARRLKIPYVLAPRGMLVPDLIRKKSRLKKSISIELFDRRTLERANLLHFTSELEKQDFLSMGLDTKRGVVIPNGIDFGDLPKQMEVEQLKQGYILYLGRINWKKGIDNLIEAMKHLPTTKLVVAGNDEDDYQEKLERIAEESGVKSHIEFIGSVFGEQKWRLLAGASVTLLPSHSENFGNVALESMAVGTPVIVSNGVGVAELIRKNKTGLVTDTQPSKIAEAIEQLLADPCLAQKMGESGRRVAREEYSWEKIAEDVEKRYEVLLGLRREGSGT